MIINQNCTVAKVSRYYEKDNNGKKTDKVIGYFINLLVSVKSDKKIIGFEFDKLYIKADCVKDERCLVVGNSICVVYDIPTLMSKFRSLVSISLNEDSKQYAIFI